MKTGKFLVLINSCYLRDTQVLNPEESIPDGEAEEFTGVYEKDENWKDACIDGYLGVYDWNKADVSGLKAYVAKKCGLQETVLEVHEIM